MVKTKVNTLLKGVGELKHNPLIENIATDSRNAHENSIFVCIKGERVDGHDYAKTAIQQGAACVLSQKILNDVPKEKTILIKSPLDAMIKIGENYKAQFSPILVGITGSVGKTTTKEFCAAIFGEFGQTIKTQGNQNNEIGMPNTLFQIEENTKYAVVEMGMQGMGEIEKLSLAAKPNAAIITCIGISHLEQLKTKDNIRKAKLEICSGLSQNAPLILNADDDMLYTANLPNHVKPVYFGIENQDADYIAKNIKSEENATSFTVCVKNGGEYEAFIPALGKHNVLNALSAFALASSLGLNEQKAINALSNYKTTGMRQKLVKYNGVTIIEDCYNASPDSMKAALETLKDYNVQKKRIAVLGDMFELGTQSENAHRQIANICKTCKVDVLIAVGNEMKKAYEDAKQLGLNCSHFLKKEEALKELLINVEKGDAVLFKASNGMNFNELLAQFYNSCNI